MSAISKGLKDMLNGINQTDTAVDLIVIQEEVMPSSMQAMSAQ